MSFKCPYDQQQCEYPRCIMLGPATDPKCFEFNSINMIKSICIRCNGSGKTIIQDDTMIAEVLCPICHGTGQMEELEAKDIGSIPATSFVLDREKATALREFLFRNGYISYEFDPLVHEILRDLNRFLGD